MTTAVTPETRKMLQKVLKTEQTSDSVGDCQSGCALCDCTNRWRRRVGTALRGSRSRPGGMQETGRGRQAGRSLTQADPLRKEKSSFKLI